MANKKINKEENNKKRKYISFRLFGFVLAEFYYYNRFGWFRLFGIGLKWKDPLVHGLVFSERNGYTKCVQIYKWRIGFLPYM